MRIQVVFIYPKINKLTMGIPPSQLVYLLGCESVSFWAQFVSCGLSFLVVRAEGCCL